MKIKEATKILKYHNEWRRGSDVEMTDIKNLGIAIDTVVEFLEEVEG